MAPSQETLAARLRCGLDTIQRSLARLAAAGLIVKTRLRDLAGRLGKCLYDLAPTLALMPSHAAKMRRGEWGAAGEAPENRALPPCRKNAASRSQTPNLLLKQTTAGRRRRRPPGPRRRLLCSKLRLRR